MENDKWSQVLTLQDACNLQTVISLAQRCAHIQFLETDHGDVIGGTVRSIGDENGNFLSADDDVRDSFVRITLDSGFEKFIPMKDAVNMARKGYLGEDR